MLASESRCLSNTLLIASLHCELPIAYNIPERVRGMLGDVSVTKVGRITLHQCPRADVVHYVLEMFTIDGDHRVEEFDGELPETLFDAAVITDGENLRHDTYVLYDCRRDGSMTHLHHVN